MLVVVVDVVAGVAASSSSVKSSLGWTGCKATGEGSAAATGCGEFETLISGTGEAMDSGTLANGISSRLVDVVLTSSMRQDVTSVEVVNDDETLPASEDGWTGLPGIVSAHTC